MNKSDNSVGSVIKQFLLNESGTQSDTSMSSGVKPDEEKLDKVIRNMVQGDKSSDLSEKSSDSAENKGETVGSVLKKFLMSDEVERPNVSQIINGEVKSDTNKKSVEEISRDLDTVIHSYLDNKE